MHKHTNVYSPKCMLHTNSKQVLCRVLTLEKRQLLKTASRFLSVLLTYTTFLTKDYK